MIAFSLNIFFSCSNEENTITKKNNNTYTNRQVVSVITANEVQIGNQVWMTHNLNVSKYRNGDIIPQITDNQQWINATTGAWCYYQNNTGNGVVYGRLYNWYAINDPRGLAPSGWHIPSFQEWLNLSSNLGNQSVGLQLKEEGSYHWADYTNTATNASGFTGLPGGFRASGGSFLLLNYNTRFWSSTAYDQDPNSAYTLELQYNNDGTINSIIPKNWSASVRCIKN